MRLAALLGLALGLAIQSSLAMAQPLAVDRSVRPGVRPTGLDVTPAAATVAPANLGFRRWIAGFRGRALAKGIRGDVFDSAFNGIEYDTSVIQKDRNQSEFVKPLWEYLDSAVSAKRVENGKAALAQHGDLLDRIEARHGVDKQVVAAIWGMESAYGAHRGTTPLIGALATLAHDGRRGRFFEAQLIAALQIIQDGDVAPRDMTGSWAGAMGHTQFIPTSYLAYAQDFTGDGKRDIWSDDPADALASTAAYLARFGWTRGQPWGIEVSLPRGFDYGLAGDGVKKPVADWTGLGVRTVSGGPIPDHGPSSILLPAGARGAAFLIFKNFHVIKRYNASDAYAIGVGHLADRIAGGPPIQADWPLGDRGLRFAERKEMQRRLTRAGFNTGGVDGRVGPNTTAALRAFQRSAGLIPDGYPSLDLLKRLR
jgi:membrane-bound lytic murein transglycosylase B